MTTWGVAIIAVAGVLTALGVILKGLRAGAKFTASIDEALPLMRVLVKVFGDNPELLKVIYEMAGQFKTDHGSSLRDVVNELDKAAKANAAMTGSLGIMLERLTVKVEAGAATGLRNESAATLVASDLADAHRRADAVAGPHGAAADAASQTAPGGQP